MVLTAWENRGDSGTDVRYLVFSKEEGDSATFQDSSKIYNLLNGGADDNGVIVNPVVEADAGYEIGFIIIDFTKIADGLTTGITNINYVTDILFTGSVTELGSGIFQGSGVTTLKVSEGITTISSTVLGGSNINNITVDANNTNFSAENGYLYNYDKTKLILCPPNDDPENSRATVTLNSATTTIGEEACAYVNYVTGVDLTNITSIEANAFKSTSMRTITNILRRTDENGDDINNSSSTLAVSYGVFDGTLIQDTFDKAASITERVTEDDTITYTITYYDIDGEEMENPKDATNEEQTYLVIAKVEEVVSAMGGNEITLTATKIFYETVEALGNSAPTFTSNLVTSATEDSVYTYTATTTDADNDTVTLTGTTIPSWLTFTSSSGVLTGTPRNSDVGSHSVVLTASDGSLSTTQEFTIVVANTNDAPTITSSPTFTANENQTSIGIVTATDPEGATLTYSVSGTELAIDSLTGVLTFKDAPDYETNSRYTATVTVTDGTNSTTQDITVNVTDVNEGPFKPATTDALQTAINKWYELANNENETTANNHEGPEYFGNPKHWDTSLITDLSYVFFKKDQDKHPDISKWDVSNVTSMQGTFSNSTFNGELNNWNVSSVIDFSFTFANNVVFNKPLFRWNVQDANTMESMFDNAYSFNQKIEPPMMQWKKDSEQYKVSATFPTQLTWNETTINGYLETIYGSATNTDTPETPQTDPTEFKGVFGMIALLKKTYLDGLYGTTHNIIKSSFSEVMSELITNQQEILKYNYTYDEDEETWKKTSPSIYFTNTDGKKDDDLNDAKDKLNQLRVNTIVDGMLLINKAYDIAKGLGADYSDLIEKMKGIYDNVYTELPFYVAWYAPLLKTKAHFLNNALTFHNGATMDSENVEATIDSKLKKFIDTTNPIKDINSNTYLVINKLSVVFYSSLDLYEKFKAYNPTESSE